MESERFSVGLDVLRVVERSRPDRGLGRAVRTRQRQTLPCRVAGEVLPEYFRSSPHFPRIVTQVFGAAVVPS